MKKRVYILIGLIMIVLGFVSCSKTQSGEVLSREFEGERWPRFDYLTASYKVVKAPMTADLVLDVTISDVFPNDYPYHVDDDGTLSIAMTITSPDGSRRSREYYFRLKDKEGNFKSEKVDGYYHYSLPLINEMSFNKNGVYTFKVENKYSKDPLCGIKKLDINCLQIKK
ncbi:MAG: hypothetical protein K6A73_03125 [Bacteroidales bacterium]|nr:hypothetical protein [Bacteroidales bacterium]